MPEVGPFRGIHYAATDQLKDLVCPPYDVISPDDQARLYKRHPHNAVRIELPFSMTPVSDPGRYEKAGRRFEDWLERRVLVERATPSLYVYRQDFMSEGRPQRVAGIIGALALEDLGGRSGVLPHEDTMPGPIEDRLALLRACPVNISPIYAIYRGAGRLTEWVDTLTNRPTEARFVDDAGTLHRLWSISAAAEVELVADALRPGPLVIADGHHRYETALAYHAEMRGVRGHHDAVMCFCVDSDSEDLSVLSYNRVLTVPSTDAACDLLVSTFSAKRLSPGEGASALAASTSPHPLLFVATDRELLVEIGDDQVAARIGDRPRVWRDLDVVVLHEVVLPTLGRDGVEHVQFTNDTTTVSNLVQGDHRTLGVVLRAPDPAQVIAVARAGRRMPQKASYFWPKAVTGVVFRSLA
jgi:uncharacterized protein (DUF1015 family)